MSQHYDDHQAHDRAIRRLQEMTGDDCAERVCWDPDHHLQGHIDVRGTHLVIIATRDDEHTPLVLTEREWDAMRRGCVPAA
ncbi:MAG: hypothetical protein QNJ12_02060 [Ilumatobacter sp.]|uniref:hypothetical protein n=1 Tax=Ilumatobacter sp. TaxID=1967498 RepID=UPI00262156EA|nr:hypothetical protein [Ilumatobacter sp.]MDJ0767540.1 hypothetical protein [Ilumatobacter sp.]